MNLPWFIARRMRGSSRGVMGAIATWSVGISVAVMVVSLAVVEGFRGQLLNAISELQGDIHITGRDSTERWRSAPLIVDSAFMSEIMALDGVHSIEAVVSRSVIIQSDSAISGVQLRGVDSLQGRQVVISQALADQIRARRGDIVDVIFVEGGGRRERFKIHNIYQSGVQELDATLILAARPTVGRIAGLDPQQADNYQITLTKGADIERALEDIDMMMGFAPYRVSTTMEDYPQIFGWITMLDSNTALVLIIMLVVAGINMMSSVLIVVLQSTAMIGLFKSQGMRTGALSRIFVFRAMPITLRGLFWGLVVGLGICYAQQWWGVVELDAQAYMVSRVPVNVLWWQVGALCAGTFAVITFISILPTIIIARMSPSENLKYK